VEHGAHGDRAIKLVKEGKFAAEDYGVYSTMKHKGSELAPLGTFEKKVPADVVAKVKAKQADILSTASSPSRSTTASPSRPPSKGPMRCAGALFLRPALLALGLAGCAGVYKTGGADIGGTRLDDTPRIAVISAFEPELTLLLGRLQGPAQAQRQRRRVHHRHAARQAGRAVPLGHQHDQCVHEHAAGAGPLQHQRTSCSAASPAA
jgi:hypothetical protein